MIFLGLKRFIHWIRLESFFFKNEHQNPGLKKNTTPPLPPFASRGVPAGLLQVKKMELDEVNYEHLKTIEGVYDWLPHLGGSQRLRV